MQLEISPFADERLDGCSRLFAAVFSGEPWNERWEPGTARIRVSQTRGVPAFLGFVNLLGGKVVGLALGGCWQEAEESLFTYTRYA